MLKRILLLAVCSISICFTVVAQDSVLVTINGKGIPKSDFEYYYNKNNNSSAIEKLSVEQYLDKYLNFKLKVYQAQELKLDTAKSFIGEMETYRNQLTSSYLTDNEAKEKLMKEAFQRMKDEIEISHIYIKLNPDKPNDTIYAYEKALMVKKLLKTESFEKVARQYSDDENVKDNNGNIGFITSLKTFYFFENAAYNTPIGQYVGPIRSMYGYHFVKVLSRRASRGRLRVAHILKLTNDTIPGRNEQAQKEIQSIYEKIKAGENFGKLAKENSDDKYSAKNGGEISWIETGTTVKEFEDAAYALKNIGDVSAPVKTKFGWHIIKLLDKKMYDNYDDFKPEIQRQFVFGDRADLVKEAFINKLKRTYNYQLNAKSMEQLGKLASKQPNDSLFYLNGLKSNALLFSFAGKNYTQSQLIESMKTKKVPASQLSVYIKTFSGSELFNYENSMLESKYPELSNMMKEYYEGSLMFLISSQKVWDKAMSDTLALKNYFDTNTSKYSWDAPHFKGRIVYCKDKKVEKKIRLILNNQSLDTINAKLGELNKKEVLVKIDQGSYAKGTNKAIDFYVFKTGQYKPETSFPIVFTEGRIVDKPENYNDVRGQVVQDYQNYLEQQWINELHSKYQVSVNRELLKTVK